MSSRLIGVISASSFYFICLFLELTDNGNLVRSPGFNVVAAGDK